MESYEDMSAEPGDPMSLIIGSDPTQLERALAETDGLLAGMRILDKAEPLDQERDTGLLDYHAGDISRATTTALGDDPPPSQSHGPVSSMELLPLIRTDVPAVLGVDGRYRDGSTNITNLVRRRNPIRVPTCYNGAPTDGDAPTQWAVLRCLRQAMVAHHRRFQEVIANSPVPAASKLAHAYPSAKAMCEKGILTFRDILNGVSPTGLAGVFAFASLSYAISILLFERGRLRREHILLGLEVWKDSIHDSEEREAFSWLAQALFLEAETQLRQPPKGLIEDSATGFRLHHRPLEGDCLESGLCVRGDGPLVSGPDMGSTSGEGLDSGYGAVPTVEEMVLQLADLSYAEFHFFELGGLSEQEQTFGRASREGNVTETVASNDNRAALAAPQPQLYLPSSESPHEPTRTNGEAAKRTHIFLAVVDFVKGAGGFLYALSGNGITTKTRPSGDGGLARADDRSRFERQTRKEFFDRLPREEADPVFLGLLSAAKKFVALGCLQTMEEVLELLTCVSRNVLSAGKAWRIFMEWIYGRSAVLRSQRSALRPERVCSRSESESRSRASSPRDRISKSKRVYTCSHPGCDRNFQTAAGRSKHKNSKHAEQTRVIDCPLPGCVYGHERRDRVRQHFLIVHGPDLPLLLQDRSRRS
ncbi:hypothetical protein B0T25DRAFT_540642 [Lasiosphaeria hispida]|uniref:C2H2-type domain-containing protein n=1 Tax=Lasiosphaeria hispida TaxID=260671 RepID=A0AAJ0HNQ0_9PEZI|nr:hypothetical protein B0T25DRAFT_540642 [Lasiosphaeria hispida]